MNFSQPTPYRILVDGLSYPDPADEPSVRAAGGLTAFAAQVSAEVFAAVHGRLRRPTRGEVVDDLPPASVSALLAHGWVNVVDEDFGAVRKPERQRPRKARTTRRKED